MPTQQWHGQLRFTAGRDCGRVYNNLYLLLADYASRVVRKGKAVVSSKLAWIFERLQSSAEIWSQRIKRLHGKTWVGRFLSASRDRLRALASKLGVRHLANIG